MSKLKELKRIQLTKTVYAVIYTDHIMIAQYGYEIEIYLNKLDNDLREQLKELIEDAPASV